MTNNTGNMDDTIVRVDGSILLYRLYDVCWETDLKLVESRIAGARRLSIDRKRFSKAFEFANPPVTIALENLSRDVSGAPRTLKTYGKVYDYGALSIILELPVSNVSTTELEAIARELRSATPFEADFTRLKDQLVKTLGDAMTGKGSPGVEEEYSIYYIRDSGKGVTSEKFCSICDLRSLLLSEQGEPDPRETISTDFAPYTFSYSENDMAIINWDNALVIEPSGVMDIPDLLEFANAQLLELRVYDRLLDRELDSIYSTIGREKTPSIWKVKHYQGLATKVMRTFTELTYVTEKVDNSLKVTDDVYYAKVYAAALELFRVKAWEDSIRKKFDIASRAYDMLTRAISNRRSELLELIIILLIAVEIVFFVIQEIRN